MSVFSPYLQKQYNILIFNFCYEPLDSIVLGVFLFHVFRIGVVIFVWFFLFCHFRSGRFRIIFFFFSTSVVAFLVRFDGKFRSNRNDARIDDNAESTIFRVFFMLCLPLKARTQFADKFLVYFFNVLNYCGKKQILFFCSFPFKLWTNIRQLPTLYFRFVSFVLLSQVFLPPPAGNIDFFGFQIFNEFSLKQKKVGNLSSSILVCGTVQFQSNNLNNCQ